MIGTLPYPANTPTTNRERLRDEQDALLLRLARVGKDPHMGVLERSAERRAIHARLREIGDEFAKPCLPPPPRITDERCHCCNDLADEDDLTAFGGICMPCVFGDCTPESHEEADDCE